MARLGVVRACLSLLTGGAPRVPATLIKGLGPVATAKLRHLVDQVRKLPPDVHPLVQEHWCQPKCFRAMAAHFRVLQEAAAFVGSLSALPGVPLVVVSSGQLPADRIDEHRELARLSFGGRHVVAAEAGTGSSSTSRTSWLARSVRSSIGRGRPDASDYRKVSGSPLSSCPCSSSHFWNSSAVWTVTNPRIR